MRRTVNAVLTVLCVSVSLLPPIAFADKPVAPQEIAGATKITAEEVVELILSTPDLVVIDARRQDEYAKGHIEGAISLLDATMERDDLARYVTQPDQPVLFYCNGIRCLRSFNAVRKALRWGYRRVFWFRGGWTEWVEKALPIAK